MNMTNRRVLVGILVVAALLRFIVLWHGDTLSDEIGYGFRAIGMLDFDEAAEQTTPLEWFDPFIPAWTKLSFHDHPPLVFLVQHIFISIFGENNFGLRISSALFGVASVYLIYLLGKRLYSARAGLIAAALLAVTINHVALSRIGLQEAQAVFFILLVCYLFLRAMDRDTYGAWITAGAALGLAFLTKYTTLVLVPILGTHLLFVRPRMLLSKKFFMGLLVSLALFSPVLLYNYKLYQAVRHFDFQLSYLFRQDPAVWQSAPGKEEFPTLAARVQAFAPNLFRFYSWIFLGLSAGAASAFLFALALNTVHTLRTHLFLLSAVLWSLALALLIGPTFRFLSPLTAFAALGIAVASAALYEHMQVKTKKILLSFTIFILLLETLYSINSQLLPYPIGTEHWMYSPLRYENYNWGYNALGAFLKNELAGKMPAIAFEQKYHFVERIHEQALARAERKGLTPYPALIIYDGNIHSQPQLWLLDRLQIYHAWPVITTETYFSFLQEQGADYFRASGVTATYFITPTEKVPLKKPHLLTALAKSFEQELRSKGMEPYRTITNMRGDDVFRVYKF